MATTAGTALLSDPHEPTLNDQTDTHATAAHVRTEHKQVGESSSCFGLKVVCFVVASLGSCLWLVASARQANRNAFQYPPCSGPGQTCPPFSNWHYWIVLFSAPVTGWHAFRRAHHGSLPWFATGVAALTYIIFRDYTVLIDSMRENCTEQNQGTLGRKVCDITYLGFSGAILVFTGQLVILFLATHSQDTRGPTSYAEVTGLARAFWQTLTQQERHVSGARDTFGRISALVLCWSGWLFWLIELAYYSNTSWNDGSVVFTTWYDWALLFGVPLMIFVSFRSESGLIPFLSVICTASLFITLYGLTLIVAKGAAGQNLGKVVKDDIHFLYTGVAGVCLVFLSTFVFIAASAPALLKHSARQKDSSSTSKLSFAGLALCLLGTLVWIVLLCKQADWVIDTNKHHNPSCSSEAKSNCFYWFEWYWWFLVLASPLVGVLAFVKTTAPSRPCYTSLFMILTYFAATVYTTDQGNVPNGSVGVYGITSCRGLFYDNSADFRRLQYCEFVAVGYTGILMLVVAFATLTYTSAGRVIADTRLRELASQ